MPSFRELVEGFNVFHESKGLDREPLLKEFVIYCETLAEISEL